MPARTIPYNIQTLTDWTTDVEGPSYRLYDFALLFGKSGVQYRDLFSTPWYIFLSLANGGVATSPFPDFDYEIGPGDYFDINTCSASSVPTNCKAKMRDPLCSRCVAEYG